MPTEPPPSREPPLLSDSSSWLFPLAMASAVLVVLAFPLYGLAHLIWIAPVPLFLAARGVGGKRGFLLGWLTGMALEAAGFIWILVAIRNFTGMGPVLSSLVFILWLLYSSVPWGILGWALGRSTTARSLLWVIPLWVGVEHYFPRLFPWHVGGALYSQSWFLQCADILGASGLTALVFLVAAGLYRFVLWIAGRGPIPLKTAGVAAALIALALVYGAFRLEAMREIERQGPRLRVGIVQGSVEPERGGLEEVELHLDRSEKLLDEAGPVDLLVWPEGTAVAYPFVLEPETATPWHFWRKKRPDLIARLERLGVPVVVGGEGWAFGEDGELEERYNVAVYLPGDGELRFYRKNRRMPFGENLSWVPGWVKDALGMDYVGGISAGRENPLMEVGGHRFRNLICYEAVLPAYVRGSSAGADFAVNITEDIWYGRTAHIPQHVSVLILRSVESRLPVVRATNIGPSGVVGITGEFRTPGRIFEEDRFVEDLVPVRPATPYDKGGHLFPLVCLIVGVAGQWRREGR